MLIVNCVLLVVAFILLILSIAMAASLHDLSYAPGILLAVSFLLIGVTIVGTFGVLFAFVFFLSSTYLSLLISFNPYRLGKLYTVYKFYLMAIGIIGSIVLMVGVFQYFLGFSVKAKTSMRYDLFHKQSYFADSKNKKGADISDSLVSSLNASMVLCIILGLIIIVAYFVAMSLTGLRAWIKVCPLYVICSVLFMSYYRIRCSL